MTLFLLVFSTYHQFWKRSRSQKLKWSKRRNRKSRLTSKTVTMINNSNPEYIDWCAGDWSEEVALSVADPLPRSHLWCQAHRQLLGERNLSGGKTKTSSSNLSLTFDSNSWGRVVWAVSIQPTSSPTADSTGMYPSESARIIRVPFDNRQEESLKDYWYQTNSIMPRLCICNLVLCYYYFCSLFHFHILLQQSWSEDPRGKQRSWRKKTGSSSTRSLCFL